MANGNGKGQNQPDMPSFDDIREILHETVMIQRKHADVMRQHAKAILQHDKAIAEHDEKMIAIDERLDRLGHHLQLLAGLYEESLRAPARKRKKQ